MSQPTVKKSPAAFKERAVKLAVASAQPIAPTARDLGINENTLPTWIGKYHRAERQTQQGKDAHLYEELKRLRKDNTRLKAARESFKKAAASFAPQLPCRTPGASRRRESAVGVAGVGFWRSRGVALTRGCVALPALREKLRSP
jgi:transposase